MSRMRRKPAPFAVGPVRVRVARGPHPDHPGRWYWRAERYEHREGAPVWAGWGTMDEATRAVAELVAAGRTQAGRSAADRGTVQHLVDTWRADVAARVDVGELAQGTADMYRVRGEWLCGRLGDVRLSAIDLGTLEAYRNARLKRGAAPRTVAGELLTLRIAWRWGQERGLAPDRRLPSVAVTIRDVRSRRTPERAEAERVLAKLKAGWRRLAGRLYFATGARLQEIAWLTWGDVDLESATIHVRGGPGRKTGARSIPISADVVGALRAWGAGPGDELVLRVSVATVRCTFGLHLRSACSAAGVEPFTPHALRRLAEDLLAEADTDPRDYADILGHSPETAMRHYRKSTASSRRRAVQRALMGELLGEQAAGVTDLDAARRRREAKE